MAVFTGSLKKQQQMQKCRRNKILEQNSTSLNNIKNIYNFFFFLRVCIWEWFSAFSSVPQIYWAAVLPGTWSKDCHFGNRADLSEGGLFIPHRISDEVIFFSLTMSYRLLLEAIKKKNQIKGI